MWSRRSQFDRGHTMLDQLENASLLEGSRDDENYRYVKMHDLIWDMARKILNESLGGRVQAGAQLTELPDGTWWRENLLIVSLMENRIKDIPSDFSPRYREVARFYLSSNEAHCIVARMREWKRLKDLRYLNLDGSGVRVLRPGILPELSKLQFLKLHQKFGVFLPVEGHEVLRLQRLETLECNFRDLENFGIFDRAGVLPLIACKVTVGRPSFSLLEDLNYTKSKSESEAWFYDLMNDTASFLSGISFRKVVIVNCQNIISLCPLVRHGSLEILHLDGLMILETLFEAPSDRLTFDPFYYLKEIVIHKCHRMKALLPPWLLSTLLHLEVIVVEDCHNMEVIIETDEQERIEGMGLKVLVLKKLPYLNSIYSGRLECNSLEEITVNDCPQLTRIPLTIPHSLKKIQVDPESLRNSIEWAIISEEPVSNPQEDALHS
uniref:Disease resistance protein At4g27190-like leucine-rich repeats domain-containing protein n=1 Tax=Salix viminalis TaxID=40686 RepID=A0A6N2MF51_SALVM